MTVSLLMHAEYARLISCGYGGRPFGDKWESVYIGHDNLQAWLLRHRVTGLWLCVIPGTNELRDWFRLNFQLLPVRVFGMPGAWARGYEDAAGYLWSQLSRRVPSDDVLNITGHSLGGAVAAALTAHAVRDERMVETVTFGAPRCCTTAAAEDVRPYGTRYVLGVDIVPRVIPGLVLRHAFDAVRLGDSSWWHAIRKRGIQALRYHRVEAYEQALREMAKEE